MLLIHRPGKKDIIYIWCKVLIIVQQLLIKVPRRTYWNTRGALQPNLPLGMRYEKAYSTQKSSLKIETAFFSLPWCNTNVFVINYIWNLRNKSWCSLFDAVLYIFGGSSNEENSVLLLSFIFSVISFPSEIFFSVTHLDCP